MNESYMTLMRAALKIGGGYLISKGIADEGAVEAIVGGIIAIAGIIMGLRSAKLKA